MACRTPIELIISIFTVQCSQSQFELDGERGEQMLKPSYRHTKTHKHASTHAHTTTHVHTYTHTHRYTPVMP